MKNIIKIGYMGWINHQNLGDEASFLVIKNLFKKHINQKFEIIGKSHHSGKEGYKLFICGGGTLLSAWGWRWMKTLNEIIKNKIPLVIFGTGVQPLDFYWPGKTNLNEKNKKLLKHVIEKSLLVGVRGPDSKNTLLEVGCNEEDIEVISDPALSFSIKDKNKKLKSEKPRVGINVGTTYNNLLGYNDELVKDHMIRFSDYLIKKSFELTFFPVWTEDIAIQNEIVSKLNSKKVKNVNKLQSLSKTVKIIKDSNLLIGEKLHSTVFAASVGTPFLSLAYRPKCIDFAKTINCEKYVVRTDENINERLKYLFIKVWDEQDKIRKNLIKVSKFYIKKQDEFAKKTTEIIN